MHHPQHHSVPPPNNDAEGLFETIFAIIWFVVSYLPFVLIGSATCIALYKYAHLSKLVSGIIGLILAWTCLCSIRAVDRAATRLEERGSAWHILLKALAVAVVAGPPFALGCWIGASFVSERPMFEQIVAGGFVGVLVAGSAYYRVMEEDV